MNTPARFEPVPPLFLAEGAVIHTSTRSEMSTNMNVEIGAPAALRVASRRLEIAVGEAGVLRIRFHLQQVTRAPLGMRGTYTISAR